VEVLVSNVPGCIDHVPEHFVLEQLYNIYVTLTGASPQLDTVCMSKQVFIFACTGEVCYEGTVKSPFPSTNTFFCTLGPVPLISF
jgi:hypothetical protein